MEGPDQDGDGSDGSGDGSGTTCPNNFDCSNHINDLDTNPSSISCASSVDIVLISFKASVTRVWDDFIFIIM